MKNQRVKTNKQKNMCTDQWDNIQPSNIDITGVPERELKK